jgi:type IV conjugative transfer system protein TraL
MDHDLDSQIVSRLNDPFKFLFLDMDLAMLSSGVFLMLLMSGLPILVTLAIPAGIAYLLHKSRQDKPRGFIQHWLYWYLPPVFLQLRAVPPMWCVRTVG